MVVMRTVDLIVKKRDGQELSAPEIRWLIDAYTQGDVGDDQMAAFLMASFFRGLGGRELSELVAAMLESGSVMDLSSVPGLKIDKHSTGGVGDKISICLAPLVAACGVAVPMISGRALGHTGGTLDKLSAIPNFRTDLDNARFLRLVSEHQLALIGQTETLAPADRKLYALRDVTGTVESIPLIAASIMSKKLAEGIDGLVLDVKCGSGAFMKSQDEALRLARTMIGIAQRMNKKIRALVTDMNQVLGRACGNANETWEALEVLKDRGPPDVVALTLELGGEMLFMGGGAESVEDGKVRIQRAIKDGRGLEKFRRVVEAQGGDPRALDDRNRLPVARLRHEIVSKQAGYVASFDVALLGRALMVLGAGRERSADPVDVSVGVEVLIRLQDAVQVGQPLFSVAYNSPERFERARAMLEDAVRFSEEPGPGLPLVYTRLG